MTEKPIMMAPITANRKSMSTKAPRTLLPILPAA